MRTFAYDEARGVALISETLPEFYGGRVLNYNYQTATAAGSMPGRLAGYSLGLPGEDDAELSAGFAFAASGQLASISAAAGPGAGGARLFEYNYLAASPGLVSGVDEMSVGYYREQTWEGDRDLLASVSTSWGAGVGAVIKSRHAYTHDERGLREGAVQSGEFFADYGGPTTMRYAYNARGELIEASQHMGDAVASPANPLPGRHWTFDYDSAGNRTAANGENYTSNGLNQTISREHNKRHLSGTGVPGARVVAVGPADSTRTPAAYQGRFWSTELLLNNADAPAKGLVNLYFGKAGAGGGRGTLLKRDAASDPGLALFMPKSPEQFIYDADGNLTADGKWSYTYDALNQLVAMETLAVENNNVRVALLSIAQGEQPKRLEFAYDYMGRRVEKKVYNYAPAAAGTAAQWVLAKTTRYLYQGWNLIAEFSSAAAGSGGTGDSPVNLDSPARTYHWGMDSAGTLTQTGGVGALLMIQEGGSQYFPAYDGNGNVTGLIDGEGETVAVYEYSPYGELLRCQGGYAKANPFRFSTKYWDEETGLIYYGLRYYSPQMGKFINRDPIGESGGLNLYGFVQNNPVNRVDVLGLACYIDIVDWIDYPDSWDEGSYTVSSRQSEPVYRWVCDDEGDDWFGETVTMAPFNVVSGRYNPFSSLTIGVNPFKIGIPDLGTPVFPASMMNYEPCASLRREKASALLSQDVYNKNGGGYTVKGTNKERLTADQLQARGFDATLIDDGTGFQSAIYQDRDTGKYTVAFAGTDLTSLNDILTDLLQPLGFHNTQYSQAADVGRTAAKAFGAGNVDSTGHSLGGAEAAMAALKGQFYGTSFNPSGIGSRTAEQNKVNLGEADARMTAYTAPFDPVSRGINRLPLVPGTNGQQTMLPAAGWLGSRHSIASVIKAIDKALVQNGCN